MATSTEVDITELIEDTTKGMFLGQMIHGEDFQLLDTINAVRMMDAKVDIHRLDNTLIPTASTILRDHPSLAPDVISPSQMIELFDAMFCLQAGVFSGYAFGSTIGCCLYFSRDSSTIPVGFLSAIISLFTKHSLNVENILSNARVAEDTCLSATTQQQRNVLRTSLKPHADLMKLLATQDAVLMALVTCAKEYIPHVSFFNHTKASLAKFKPNVFEAPSTSFPLAMEALYASSLEQDEEFALSMKYVLEMFFHSNPVNLSTLSSADRLSLFEQMNPCDVFETMMQLLSRLRLARSLYMTHFILSRPGASGVRSCIFFLKTALFELQRIVSQPTVSLLKTPIEELSHHISREDQLGPLHAGLFGNFRPSFMPFKTSKEQVALAEKMRESLDKDEKASSHPSPVMKSLPLPDGLPTSIGPMPVTSVFPYLASTSGMIGASLVVHLPSSFEAYIQSFNATCRLYSFCIGLDEILPPPTPVQTKILQEALAHFSNTQDILVPISKEKKPTQVFYGRAQLPSASASASATFVPLPDFIHNELSFAKKPIDEAEYFASLPKNLAHHGIAQRLFSVLHAVSKSNPPLIVRSFVALCCGNSSDFLGLGNMLHFSENLFTSYSPSVVGWIDAQRDILDTKRLESIQHSAITSPEDPGNAAFLAFPPNDNFTEKFPILEFLTSFLSNLELIHGKLYCGMFLRSNAARPMEVELINDLAVLQQDSKFFDNNLKEYLDSIGLTSAVAASSPNASLIGQFQKIAPSSTTCTANLSSVEAPAEAKFSYVAPYYHGFFSFILEHISETLTSYFIDGLENSVFSDFDLPLAMFSLKRISEIRVVNFKSSLRSRLPVGTIGTGPLRPTSLVSGISNFKRPDMVNPLTSHITAETVSSSEELLVEVVKPVGKGQNKKASNAKASTPKTVPMESRQVPTTWVSPASQTYANVPGNEKISALALKAMLSSKAAPISMTPQIAMAQIHGHMAHGTYLFIMAVSKMNKKVPRHPIFAQIIDAYAAFRANGTSSYQGTSLNELYSQFLDYSANRFSIFRKIEHPSMPVFLELIKEWTNPKSYKELLLESAVCFRAVFTLVREFFNDSQSSAYDKMTPMLKKQQTDKLMKRLLATEESLGTVNKAILEEIRQVYPERAFETEHRCKMDYPLATGNNLVNRFLLNTASFEHTVRDEYLSVCVSYLKTCEANLELIGSLEKELPSVETVLSYHYNHTLQFPCFQFVSTKDYNALKSKKRVFYSK